jgi:aspartate-semialdehyde dehydrogenase
VPVRVAHSEAITVEFHKPISVADAKAALAKAPGIVFMDETKDGKFPQPLHAAGSDHTFVGRVRQDPSNPSALCLWVVADNLRKGAASNAVQCAEELVRRGIVK